MKTLNKENNPNGRYEKKTTEEAYNMNVNVNKNLIFLKVVSPYINGKKNPNYRLNQKSQINFQQDLLSGEPSQMSQGSQEQGRYNQPDNSRSNGVFSYQKRQPQSRKNLNLNLDTEPEPENRSIPQSVKGDDKSQNKRNISQINFFSGPSPTNEGSEKHKKPTRLPNDKLEGELICMPCENDLLRRLKNQDKGTPDFDNSNNDFHVKINININRTN